MARRTGYTNPASTRRTTSTNDNPSPQKAYGGMSAAQVRRAI